MHVLHQIEYPMEMTPFDKIPLNMYTGVTIYQNVYTNNMPTDLQSFVPDPFHRNRSWTIFVLF